MPIDDSAAFERLRRLVQAAPKLIPIYGHRYLPSLPFEPGNPVLSVHQSGIICYGVDLEDYFQNEYSHHVGPTGYQLSAEPKHIEFWSELMG